jgi:hypothetical protein
MGHPIFSMDKAIMDKLLVEPTLLEIPSDLDADATAEQEKENSKLIGCYEIEKNNWERSNHKCLMVVSNMAARLKPIYLAIKDGFLIYLIFNSLPKELETFDVNYNSMNEKWALEKFMAMCVQEEERIKGNNGGVDSVNLAKHNNKNRNFVSKSAPKNEEKGKGAARRPAEKDQCK